MKALLYLLLLSIYIDKVINSFFGSKSRSSRKSSRSSDSTGSSSDDLILNDLVLKNKVDQSKLKYNSGYKNVLKKLEDNIKNNPDDKDYIIKKYNSIENLAFILSDKDAFKECYFKSYSKYEILKDIDTILDNVNTNNQDYSEKEIQMFKDNINEHIKDLNDQKLEFRLSPIEGLDNNNLRMFTNTIGDKFGIWKYGALHSSLALNGIILEWDDSSLVWPSPDYERIIFYSQEIKESKIWSIIKWLDKLLVEFSNVFIQFISENWKLKTILDKEIDKICEKCVEFNTRRYYSASNINCQFFVDQILQNIDVDLKFEGEMEKAIDYVKKNGKLDYIFRGYKFETRKQLDNYVKNNINFDSLSDDEKKLLFLYKTTMERSRLQKIQRKENQGIYETTDEAIKMWSQLEISYKENNEKIQYL